MNYKTRLLICQIINKANKLKEDKEKQYVT